MLKSSRLFLNCDQNRQVDVVVIKMIYRFFTTTIAGRLVIKNANITGGV